MKLRNLYFSTCNKCLCIFARFCGENLFYVDANIHVYCFKCMEEIHPHGIRRLAFCHRCDKNVLVDMDYKGDVLCRYCRLET